MNRLVKLLSLMNLTTLALSLTYLLLPRESLFWNGYGLLLVVTLTANIVLSMTDSPCRKLTITYLSLSSFGLFAVMVLNTLASLNPTTQTSRSSLSIGIFLMLLIVGTALTSLPLIHKTRPQKRPIHSLSGSKSTSRTRKGTKLFFRILLALGLALGVFSAIVMVTSFGFGIVEILISQYSLFYSFIFLSLAGLFLKLSSHNGRSLLDIAVSITGVTLFFVFALPFLSIPSMLNDAKANYTAAFGEEWQTYGADISSFRTAPLSIPAYFFGIPSNAYTLTEDVIYYEGTEGVDDGLELRFDVYTPPQDAENLPGERSALVRIHGGGWDTGGKGPENFAQVNKYFAAQGYVVFDVQYGLNNQDQFDGFSTVPKKVSGEFSIDDMVRHLGLFTTYLADNHEDYDANIDSVFFSGGSAGGHLATAVALASSSGQYPDKIDSRIQVKGIIPFYPANGLAGFRNIGGEDELVDPALLVEEDSPPSLVYQGDNDGIVNQEVAERFKDTYLDNDNNEVAIILMPYGAHASDLYFSGFYNQTFMYYMERFMYQNK